jgi:hypothetical protein
VTAGRFTKLAVTLLCGALVAGCGSSNSSTTSSTPTTTPAKSSSAAATTPTTASKSSTSKSTASTTPTQPTAGTVAGATAAEYATVCKSIITHEPTLESSLKSKLEGICSKAADGDLAGARAAAKQVCVEVIKSTPIPAADKEKALAACKGT